MKKSSLFVAVVVIALVAIFASAPTSANAAPAISQPAQESQPVLPSLPDVVETAKNLGGLALLFTAGINAAKKFGWMKDGSAPAVSLVFNTVTVVGLVVLQISGRADIVPVIDQNAGILATVLTSMLALMYNLWLSRKGHEEVLSGMPVIGTSFSNRYAGQSEMIAEITE